MATERISDWLANHKPVLLALKIFGFGKDVPLFSNFTRNTDKSLKFKVLEQKRSKQ